MELHNQAGVMMDSLGISVKRKQPGCEETPGTAKSHKLKYVNMSVIEGPARPLHCLNARARYLVHGT